MQKFPAAVMSITKAGHGSIPRSPAPDPLRAGSKELDSNFNGIFDRINRIVMIIFCFHHLPEESNEISWLSSGKSRSKYPINPVDPV
jgi:hypothetical protein